jgi:hypothetical protein
MGDNDRWVTRNDDGTWSVKKPGAERASSKHDTQKDAIDSARDALKKSGGGELIVQGTDGKIRSKDTIPPAKDPFPPRDKEH